MRRRCTPRRRPLVLALAVVPLVGLPVAAHTAGLTGVPRASVEKEHNTPPTYTVVESGSPAPPRGGTLGAQYTGMYVTVTPLTGSGPTALEAGNVRIKVLTSGATSGYHDCSTTGTARQFLCSYASPLGSAIARPTLVTTAPNAPVAVP